jgi:CRP-like cAMP-binding protein
MEWKLTAGVPPDDVRALVAVARRRTFSRNEVVFHRDDPADSLHLVAAGHFAARVVTPLGDTITLSVHGPGDSFGELALLDETGVRSATVAALERGETLSVFRDDFRALAARHPGVDAILVRLLAHQVGSLTRRLVEAHTLPAETRVLRRLAELAAVYGGDGGAAVVPLTQEDLAGLAGTSRATVNQVLGQQQKRGVVELGRGRTTVLDADALRRAR